MKKFGMKLLMIAVGVMFGLSAFAQTYPYTNPTYLPNVVFPQITVASNVNSSTVTLNGVGTLTLNVSGTCTSLAGLALKASNDGTNYSTVNMYQFNATSAVTPVTSIASATLATATMYAANMAGYSSAYLTNTGVGTTTCKVNLVGSPVSFSMPR